MIKYILLKVGVLNFQRCKKYCCCKEEYEIGDVLLDFERPIAML